VATTFKRLGAITSSGTLGTADTLYTAPGAGGVVVSTLTVCNQSTASVTYRICISTTTSFQTTGYIIYEATLLGNEGVGITYGITLDPTNKYLLCSASSSSVSFTAFGSEIS
jgi:hypothetical protein